MLPDGVKILKKYRSIHGWILTDFVAFLSNGDLTGIRKDGSCYSIAELSNKYVYNMYLGLIKDGTWIEVQ